MAAAQKILKAAGYEAAAGTVALKVVTAALYATLTMGISLAIEAFVAAFSALSKKGKDAADSMEEVDEAAKAYDEAFISARSEMASYIVKLEDLIKHKGDERVAVNELNEKYGESFGYHRTAAEWYDTLLQKSKDYARQLGLEAKAKVPGFGLFLSTIKPRNYPWLLLILLIISGFVLGKQLIFLLVKDRLHD